MSRRSYAVFCAALVAVSLWVLYFGMHAWLGKRDASRMHTPTYRVSISDPRPGEALPVFTVTQGDVVTLLVSSDRKGEVHLHGYEKKVVLEPGHEVILTFTAQHAGMYPLHLHEPLNAGDPAGAVVHRHLASVEVQPE